MVSTQSLLCFCLLSFSVVFVSAIEVSHDGRALKINGQRKLFISGAIHYPRSTPQMWRDLINKSKEGGLNTIETYIFWNLHEPVRRQYDFTGNKDFIKFIKMVQQAGLYVFLRIGPYVCAEWNYGGFPVWLHNLPSVKMRTDNAVFKNEMQIFTTLIVNMVKKEKLFASQGGPIILAQIENEYGNIMAPYGDAGKVYINWCAKMAESFNINVPWIMCQQNNAPQPMINTCNGFYCDSFQPNNLNSPKMWTENWLGWFQTWGDKLPYRRLEDVAYATARFYQTGGTFNNYYMYHGGTNFDRTASAYMTTSYDYDAPLDEYGNMAQPKWGHLKELHKVLMSMERTLTYGNISQTNLANSVNATVYATNESSSCFLSNNNNVSDATVTFRGKTYTIPAWSVSILSDCENEAYNTAKVNAQTSIKAYRPDNSKMQQKSLEWVWMPENINDALKGISNFSADALLDQKEVTGDSSDYLWYMNILNLKKDDVLLSNDMSLRVNTSGHLIYAFVNGQLLGSQWGKYGTYNDKYEVKIKLKPGKNVISLLSTTVGLQNYGSFFDTWHNGLVGPVEVISIKGDETIIKNISSSKWAYKIGFDGWNKKLFSGDSQTVSKWSSTQRPTNRSFTWYKTTFKAPEGKDPVVVDLQGMGKGYAWVNGHNIGRYWPSYISPKDNCSDTPCDYRGEYSATKCLTNCGMPSQRRYHVPRCFLKNGENTLVLFEEMGGNPDSVTFQTVFVERACANAHENRTLELSCHNSKISAIKFASFGNPQGVCGAFAKGSCVSKNDALPILQKACAGKQKCSIDISKKTFGPTNCGNIAKTLAVEAVC